MRRSLQLARNLWSENELVALDAVAHENGMAAYHAWGALTGYSKSYNAFEVKRRRVTQGTPATQVAGLFGSAGRPAPVLATPDQTEDFSGFTMGFFDIETTFSTQPLVLYAAIADQFGNVEQFRKGPVITDDRALVEAYCKRLEEYDILVGWNSTLFDIAVLRGRQMFHGFPPLDPHMSIDLMYKASGSAARIGRRSLQSVSEYFDVPNRKTPLNVRTWDLAMTGDEAAYEKIVEHCDADVLVTRDVFKHLKRGIRSVHRLS
jgi:uncharacterized protein YprB with RNaseH-like and TPR domain